MSNKIGNKGIATAMVILGALLFMAIPITSIASDVEMDGAYAYDAPIIDGDISEVEWGQATFEEYDFDNGTYEGVFVVGIMNDDNFLYVLADLTFNTDEDEGYCGIIIDTDGDGNLDMSGIGTYEDGIIVLDNTSLSINNVGGAVASGYDETWNEDDIEHMFYEFAIPLVNIGYDNVADFDEPVVLGVFGNFSSIMMGGMPVFMFPEDAGDVIEYTLIEGEVVSSETDQNTKDYVMGFFEFGAVAMLTLGALQLFWLNKPFEELKAWQQWIMMNDRWLLVGIGAGVIILSHFTMLDFIGQYVYDFFDYIHGLLGY